MVAVATVFGVPVRAPVVVLKLIPGGVELMEYLAIAPPVEVLVNPVAAVPTVLLSLDEDKVNAGSATDVITRLPVPSMLTATNKPFPNATDHQVLFTPVVRLVQFIPSGLVITRLLILSLLTATNKPFPLTVPYVTELHWIAAAGFREVQFIPSGLVITLQPLSLLTATNNPFPLTVPYVTEVKVLTGDDAVPIVQVIPSGLLITSPCSLTATNKPLPYVTEIQVKSPADAPPVHVIPSGLVITRLLKVGLVPPTATNNPLPLTVPYVTEYQSSASTDARLVQVIPSGLVITRLVPLELTATNNPIPLTVPYVTEFQPLFAADVRLVQVIPSGLVITRLPLPLWPTATNNPLP